MLAIQAAGASLEQFGDYVGEFFETTLPNIVTSHAVNVNPFTGMISTSIASLNQFATSVGQIMAKVRQAFAAGLGGVKQTGGAIPIQVNIAPAIKQLQSLKVQIGLVKQSKPVPIALNIAPAVQAANKIRSIVNALPNIKRTITYTYRIVGSRPNPPNLNKTITYRYRPWEHGLHKAVCMKTFHKIHLSQPTKVSV